MSNHTGLSAHHLWLEDLLSCGKLGSEHGIDFGHKKSDEILFSLYDQEVLLILSKSLTKAFDSTINKADLSMKVVTDIIQLLTWMASYSRESCQLAFSVVKDISQGLVQLFFRVASEENIEFLQLTCSLATELL